MTTDCSKPFFPPSERNNCHIKIIILIIIKQNRYFDKIVNALNLLDTVKLCSYVFKIFL